MTKPFKVNEGFDPKVIYLIDVKNEIKKHGRPVRGHLMVDEIKLKNEQCKVIVEYYKYLP